MEMWIPHDFSGISFIQVLFTPASNTVEDMHGSVYTEYGAIGAGYTTHAEEVLHAVMVPGVSVPFRLMGFDISGLVDSGPLAAGDLLGVTVMYSSLPPATDIYVFGLRLRYV